MSEEKKCVCAHDDSRDCFLMRHPECHRGSDSCDPDTGYEAAIFEVCDCYCHYEHDISCVEAE